MSFTVVFPSICDLDLNNAEVFTYIEDCNTKYTMGIGLYSSLGKNCTDCFDSIHFNWIYLWLCTRNSLRCECASVEIPKTAIIFLNKVNTLHLFTDDFHD